MSKNDSSSNTVFWVLLIVGLSTGMWAPFMFYLAAFAAVILLIMVGYGILAGTLFMVAKNAENAPQLTEEKTNHVLTPEN